MSADEAEQVLELLTDDERERLDELIGDHDQADEVEHVHTLALDRGGRLDVEVLSGDVEAHARRLMGSLVVTFEGEPGDVVELAVRGDRPKGVDS